MAVSTRKDFFNSKVPSSGYDSIVSHQRNINCDQITVVKGTDVHTGRYKPDGTEIIEKK